MQNDKITCSMHPDGTIDWKYFMFNDLTRKQVELELNQKTAVIEIGLQGMKQTAREMDGDVLVVTYSKEL